MDNVTTALCVVLGFPLVLAIAGMAIAIAYFLLANLYALVWPYVSPLIDMWRDWFERRTG